MNTLIISLNFNAGHFSHLVANYKLFEDCGYRPFLYVHPSFNQMDEKKEFKKFNTSRDLRQFDMISVAVFWFPSLKNIVEIARLKFLYKSKIVYVYHEPFTSIKSYYNAGFRFKKIAKICLIHAVNIPILLMSDKIILPSAAAFSCYEEKYTIFNKKYFLIPLLFDDELVPSLSQNNKKYIAYIGTVAADHAFDKFVAFVEACLINKWFSDKTFLIATSSNIPTKEKNMLLPYIQTGAVVISEGRFMTTEVINLYYKDSLVVWNAYNRSMQSGVLPKAYMFGAAVIVLFQNANEFIDDHKTGILVKDNSNIIEIKQAIEKILGNDIFFYQNCRNKFLKNFYYKSKLDTFRNLL